MALKDLTVVITTFKSEKKINNCLASLGPEVKVIIVENSNNDKFTKDLESQYTNVRCILTGENTGYAKGNNLGLKEVKTRYALVLNPDTIVAKDALHNFINSAKKDLNFFLIGPDQKNSFSIKKEIYEVENIKGFALFFNMQKFNNIFFDENYFLYFEEIDLCKKIRKAGGKIYLDTSIKIIHEGGKSVNVNSSGEELEKNRNWHWMWSTFYYHKKYNSFFFALKIVLPKLISAFIKIIFYRLIFNKKRSDIYFFRFSGLINSILGKKSWHRPSLD